MFHEDDLLPISALQHLIFCERQCALIHVERLWAENRLTVEGQQLHIKAHAGQNEYRERMVIARGLTLRSCRLGLFGVADVVELVLKKDVAAAIQPRRSRTHRTQDWPNSVERAVPIEYKRGRPKKDDSDRVQLAAQAICLEEMFGISVEFGHLFYGQRRRRTEIPIDDSLRAVTESATRRLHEMIADKETPRAVQLPKCKQCSLVNLCLPHATQPSRNAKQFFQRQLSAVLAANEPHTDHQADAWSVE